MGKKKVELLAAIGVLAVAAIACAVIFGGREKVGVYNDISVLEMEGDVSVTRVKEQFTPAVDMHLNSGDVISVPENGYLRLRIDADKYLYVAPGSVVSIEGTKNGEDTEVYVMLEKGEVVTEVQSKLSEKSSFKIITANSALSIKGTIVDTQAEAGADGTVTSVNSVLEGSGELLIVTEGKDGTLNVCKTPLEEGKTVSAKEPQMDEKDKKNIKDVLKSENEDKDVNLNLKKEIREVSLEMSEIVVAEVADNAKLLDFLGKVQEISTADLGTRFNETIKKISIKKETVPPEEKVKEQELTGESGMQNSKTTTPAASNMGKDEVGKRMTTPDRNNMAPSVGAGSEKQEEKQEAKQEEIQEERQEENGNNSGSSQSDNQSNPSDNNPPADNPDPVVDGKTKVVFYSNYKLENFVEQQGSTWGDVNGYAYEENGFQPYSVRVDVGETYTLPTNVTREGFIFLGWCADEELSEVVTSVTPDSNEDISLYSKFVPLASYTFAESPNLSCSFDKYVTKIEAKLEKIEFGEAVSVSRSVLEREGDELVETLQEGDIIEKYVIQSVNVNYHLSSEQDYNLSRFHLTLKFYYGDEYTQILECSERYIHFYFDNNGTYIYQLWEDGKKIADYELYGAESSITSADTVQIFNDRNEALLCELADGTELFDYTFSEEENLEEKVLSYNKVYKIRKVTPTD